jgi:hypothetical protein
MPAFGGFVGKNKEYTLRSCRNEGHLIRTPSQWSAGDIDNFKNAWESGMLVDSMRPVFLNTSMRLVRLPKYRILKKNRNL